MKYRLPLSSLSRYAAEWVLLGGVLLLVALILGLFVAQKHQEIGVHERDRLAVSARVVHDALVRQLDTVNRTLVGIRDELPRWQAQGDGRELAERRLRAFVDAMPAVRTLLVLDAQGDVVAANHEALRGKNFRERVYFQAVQRQPQRVAACAAGPAHQFFFPPAQLGRAGGRILAPPGGLGQVFRQGLTNVALGVGDQFQKDVAQHRLRRSAWRSGLA